MWVIPLFLAHVTGDYIPVLLFYVVAIMSGEAKKVPPGFTGKAYPEVFNAIPPQPKQLKPGQLSAEQVKTFFDEVCKLEFAAVRCVQIKRSYTVF